MKLYLVAFLLVPACTGFFTRIRDHLEEKGAQIKDHFEKKLKKPECHVEWEDVFKPHCETHHEQVCVEEFKNLCRTEYSTSCETEYSRQCKTEYEELCETMDHQKCHTEHEQECHTEYAEKCWDEPECWMEQKEECHYVQVKVHHHQPKQQYKKWKRSDDGEDEGEDSGVDDMSIEDESGEEEAVELPEDAEDVEGEVVVEADGSVRKKRFLAGAGLGALVGGHIGKKLGLGVGLAIGLGSKKIALKNLQGGKAPVHVKKAHKAVHHKQHFKTEKVCKYVPTEQCTNHQVCEQVPKQRCVSVPHEVCVNVPETKCWKEPSEKCWEEPIQKCHQVPEEMCWKEPHQKCWDEPKEHCHDKWVRVERKVCVHEVKKTEVSKEKKW